MLSWCGWLKRLSVPNGNDDDKGRLERALAVAYTFAFDPLTERRSGPVDDNDDGNGRNGYGGRKEEDDRGDGFSIEIPLRVFLWLS